MPYPQIYDVTFSYTGFQQSQGNNSFPGTQLDADLQGLKSSVSSLSTFTKNVIRSDGALNNGTVTFDSLAPSLQTAGLSPADAWGTAITYLSGKSVVQDSALYRAVVAHTSGVFATDLAAGKWILVGELIAGPAGAPGPTYSGDKSIVLTSGAFSLSGDNDAPDNNCYYGTNDVGAKGFYPVASSFGYANDFVVANYPGGDPSGVGDSSAAVAAAIADLQAAGSGRILFGPGSFRMDATTLLSNNDPNIRMSIVGAGRNATRLVFNVATDWWFDIGQAASAVTSNITFENMTFVANEPQTAGGAFRLRKSRFVQFLNVNVISPFQLMQLGGNSVTNDCLDIIVDNIIAQPGTSNVPFFQLNSGGILEVRGGKFNGIGQAGNYLFGHSDANFNWDGVTLTDFTGEQWTRFISSTGAGIANLRCQSVIVDRPKDYWLHAYAGLGGVNKDWMFTNCIIGGDPGLPGVIGANVQKGNGDAFNFQFVNNQFTDLTSTAVYVGTGVRGSIINSNIFTSCGREGHSVIRVDSTAETTAIGNIIRKRNSSDPGPNYCMEWSGTGAVGQRIGSGSQNSLSGFNTAAVIGTP